MLISEWEIWQTFSSYFVDSIDDLEKVTKNLVKSGLLECAFSDSGNYYWRDNGELLSGHVEITLGANRSEAWVDIKSATPDGYAQEMILDIRFPKQMTYDLNNKDELIGKGVPFLRHVDINRRNARR